MVDGKYVEKCLLGSVIADATDNPMSGLADQLLSYCTVEMFSSSASKDTFKAIKACRARIVAADLESVCQYLVNDNNMAYVSDACNIQATYSSIDILIENLRLICDSNNLKGVLSRATIDLEKCKDLSTLKDDYDKIERDITASFSNGKFTNDKNSGDISSFMAEYFQRKQEAIRGTRALGTPIGFPTYDEMTGGARGGELYLIAGLPGMGKSTYLLTVIAFQIIQGYAPILFSMEMDDDEIIDKLMCILSFLCPYTPKINYNRIRNPQFLSSDEHKSMAIISGIIKESGAYLNIDPSINLQQIKTESRKLNAERKLGIIGIDYLQLMIRDEKLAKEELSEMSRELAKLSKELNKSVWALSQLNVRDCKVGDRPHKGMLKGSGALEANASVILFPWRDYAIKEEGDASKATLIKGKHRHWKGKDINMGFCQETTAFYEVDNTHNSEGGKF